MGLAKTKQALRRGYAVAAMSSLDRNGGGGGRCFQWWADGAGWGAGRIVQGGVAAAAPALAPCRMSCLFPAAAPPSRLRRGDDAKAAADVLRKLPALLRLPKGAPVYADGASSGGSIVLRLPRLVKLDGVVGGERCRCCGHRCCGRRCCGCCLARAEAWSLTTAGAASCPTRACPPPPPPLAPPPEVIAPGNFRDVLSGLGASPMPPALYIHMPRDAGEGGERGDPLLLLLPLLPVALPPLCRRPAPAGR